MAAGSALARRGSDGADRQHQTQPAEPEYTHATIAFGPLRTGSRIR